ncbi:hypothetical protein OUZ56_007025 [Daphnia magna]|uniref:Uncharacterized protein n=1 Tax=Daphnia magna TaxID=35525 RepID=A0ABQ9YXD0_9CRUS|nr:hypothetical protein OUZ56_007025 [Daphnia magna]
MSKKDGCAEQLLLQHVIFEIKHELIYLVEERERLSFVIDACGVNGYDYKLIRRYWRGKLTESQETLGLALSSSPRSRCKFELTLTS